MNCRKCSLIIRHSHHACAEAWEAWKTRMAWVWGGVWGGVCGGGGRQALRRKSGGGLREGLWLIYRCLST
jgi:hypothetical protein